MSDDTDAPERPPRYYGSDAENVKGVDNIQEVDLAVSPDEYEFRVSYPNAEGYSIALPRAFGSDPDSGGEW